ncbi:MAG: hypothetical protein P8N19_09795 [Flavobacteriales bacterium]|nr:hypothetical protein [Flavobacteriales bacterium]MDG1767703.1 hypothetical protein [Flavobacteriales bacterium]
MKRSRVILGILLMLLAGLAIYWWRDTPIHFTREEGKVIPRNALELAFENYHEEVLEASEDLELPYEYLMALTVLECSGKKPAGKRYEKGVYDRLQKVKSGEKRKYEQVRHRHLKNASDAAIENLATSWGPFQLMGYKCIGMDVEVADIRGDDAVFYGAKWVKAEYGHLLKKERYKDAFHYHNTGRTFPRSGNSQTHNPMYVTRGLEYMKYFEKRLKEEEAS